MTLRGFKNKIKGKKEKMAGNDNKAPG